MSRCLACCPTGSERPTEVARRCCESAKWSIGSRDRPRLGFAADLGTTKVAGYLVDLNSGQVLASRGVMNPQISYGEDVMARIAYSMDGREQEETLRRAVVDGFNDMIEGLCAGIGTGPDSVVDAVIVGNTAMHHLFLGLPVRQLGLAPYLAAVSEPLDVKARDLGLTLAPGAYVHVLPNIAGFVGADTWPCSWRPAAPGRGRRGRAGHWHQHRGRAAGQRPAADLLHRFRPGFRGGAHPRRHARHRWGHRTGADGGRTQYATRRLATSSAIGLCGSGILDAVAELFRTNVLDRRGAIRLTRASARRRAGASSSWWSKAIPAAGATSSSPAATSARSSWPRAP